MVSVYSGIPISRTSKGNDNWFEKSGVRNIGGKIAVKRIEGKRLLVRVIGIFEKSRVREIGTPLSFVIYLFATQSYKSSKFNTIKYGGRGNVCKLSKQRKAKLYSIHAGDLFRIFSFAWKIGKYLHSLSLPLAV